MDGMDGMDCMDCMDGMDCRRRPPGSGSSAGCQAACAHARGIANDQGGLFGAFFLQLTSPSATGSALWYLWGDIALWRGDACAIRNDRTDDDDGDGDDEDEDDKKEDHDGLVMLLIWLAVR
ncbi:hypothetical protein EJ05DRAFT_485230 [Pseudovirgaria hyperparasitica]|uniref:Uncharacterized protein n=1 Tax=Pseudovirgaria hyperparasitica TaxID=470096 RepID=A0A6A6WDI7_9PEZI|nr:uncharacterized protein EJ05DRAFT_485230 [Pseudovirgaria hyperparasitica]KAF2759171.1 hypothetical protein EJ05DRAFT_485230 [Pseudovirgaria hyperparasitica]